MPGAEGQAAVLGGSVRASTTSATTASSQPPTTQTVGAFHSPRAYRARVSRATSPYPTRPGAKAMIVSRSAATASGGALARKTRAIGPETATSTAAATAAAAARTAAGASARR